MITIAVDAMSGDRGYPVAATAIKNIIAAQPQLEVIAVGQQAVLEPVLAGVDRVRIHDAPEVIKMTDNPLASLRRRKTSIFQAISLVKDGAAQAALSCGNTGVLMGMARIILKMLPGYSRPAIASYIPCDKCRAKFCMLDLGANVDRDADMLVSFAYLGDALVRAVDNLEQPSIGLLNIGEEQLKGGAEIQEAAKRLTESRLNFYGNVEANTLFDKVVDVVVCDGFTGNVFLKSIEGVSSMIKNMLVDSYTANTYAKVAGLASKPVLNNLKETIDARRYNGAAFLGLRGLVVKSHGNADEVALTAALDFTVKQVQQDLIGMLSDQEKPA